MGDLDHFVKQDLGVREYLRYMDDCLDPRAARRFRARMRDLQSRIDAGTMTEEDAARSGASRVGHVAFANTLQFRRSFFQRLYAGD